MCETSCGDVDMRKVRDKFKVIGFDVAYKNRSVLSPYKWRGLAIAIRHDKSFKLKVILNPYEALLSIKVDMSSLGTHKDLVIKSVYIPPNHTRYAKALHIDELDNLLLSYSHICHYHLLCVDFNAHTGVMEDILGRSDDSDRYITIKNDFYTKLQYTWPPREN